VRGFVPLPSEGAVSNKLEYFFKHGQEYDAVLFGTSRIMAGMDPVLIESELAERGINLKLFNLGLPNVAAYEVDYYFRKILAGNYERLKTVLVEAWWTPPISIDRNSFTHRRVEWHSLRQTIAAASAALAMPDWSLQEKLKQAVGHVQHFAWRLVSYGRGRDLVAAALSPPSEATSTEANQGYRPWRPDLEENNATGRGKKLSWSRPKPPHRNDKTGFDFSLYRKQAQLGAERGITMIHVIPPGFRDPFPAALLRSRVEHLIDYRPMPPGREGKHARLAFLNDPDLHMDGVHLTQAGARGLSLLVVDDLARLLGE
jgi:hypothetical protein